MNDIHHICILSFKCVLCFFFVFEDVTNQSSSQATEEGISIAAAKHASEDAAILLQYMLALLVYSMFFKELKEIKETIQALQEQVEKNDKQRKGKVSKCIFIIYLQLLYKLNN